MKIRYIHIILILFLLFPFAGELKAQIQRISGEVYVDQSEEDVIANGMFQYNRYVVVYTFTERSDAESALRKLQSSPNSAINTYLGMVKPNEAGKFTVDYYSIAPVMLVWCSDRRYESKVLEGGIIRNGMRINLPAKGAADKGVEQEDMTKKVHELQNVTIEEKKIKTGTNIATSEEEDGLITSQVMIEIPYPDHIKRKNLRVVAQPMWYDRVDMIDEMSDTVFSYGRVVFGDSDEYLETQTRLMDYDVMRDTLYSYNEHAKNHRYNRIVRKKTKNSADEIVEVEDTLISRISFTKDSIHIFIIDTVSGIDPDGSHPYPFGAIVAVGDYNTVIYKDSSKRNNGERRSPLKFLDFKFKEFMPDPEDFREDQNEELQQVPGELHLNFEVGKATIIPNDSTSIAQLEDLRKTFSSVSQNGGSILAVTVHGMASPEGNLAGNKDLARRRAQYAINEIHRFTNSRIDMEEPEVAGWNKVADLLAADGYASEAEAVNEIVNKYPGNIYAQYGQIKNLPYYRELIYDIYLPKLRTVRYSYIFRKYDILSADELLKRFKENKGMVRDRGSFFALFNEITDKKELEPIAKHALEVTRNNYSADSIYNKGYWAYPACLLACCYIARDTADYNLLMPFLDLKPIKVWNDSTQSYDLQISDPEIKREGLNESGRGKILNYVNFPEFAANQLIMILNTGGLSQYRNIVPSLEAIITGAIEKGKAGMEYDTIMAMSKCYRGGYKVGNISKTEAEAAKVRNIAASTSSTNLVVVNLAADEPYDTSDDNKYLAIAADGIKNLPDNAESDYLKSVTMLRLNKREQAEQYLAESFMKDYKMMAYANNDLDLMPNPESAEDSDYKVIYGAMRLWKATMDTISAGNDKHAYTWYKKSLEELNKGKTANIELAKEHMYRCFNLDNRYFTILGVAIRNDDAIRKKKDIVATLKEFRKNYSSAE